MNENLFIIYLFVFHNSVYFRKYSPHLFFFDMRKQDFPTRL